MGKCTEDELREVDAWLDESDENARELFRLEEIYHLGKYNDSQDEKKIEKAEKRLIKRLEQEKAKQHKARRMYGWMRYAAIFIGLFIWVVWDMLSIKPIIRWKRCLPLQPRMKLRN